MNTFQKVRRLIHQKVPTNTKLTTRDICDIINTDINDWKNEYTVNQLRTILGKIAAVSKNREIIKVGRDRKRKCVLWELIANPPLGAL